MKRFLITFSALIFLLAISGNFPAQIVENDLEQNVGRRFDGFLGVKLKPEVRLIIAEIEWKTVNKFYADFVRQGDFILGSSYISEDGVPTVLIDYKLENGDRKKLEAIITHELLHLRLTANGYPAFIFSESVNTAKGRAIDTEQSNINDLRSLIEHQIFKADMQKFDLYKYIHLAGDTANSARKNKSREDGQADAINYARAILEYPHIKDVEEVEKIYAANKWSRSLREGKAIADLISASNPRTAKDSETVFLKCIEILYPFPNSAYTFKLMPDPTIKTFKRMIVSISKRTIPQRKSSKRS